MKSACKMHQLVRKKRRRWMSHAAGARQGWPPSWQAAVFREPAADAVVLRAHASVDGEVRAEVFACKMRLEVPPRFHETSASVRVGGEDLFAGEVDRLYPSLQRHGDVVPPGRRGEHDDVIEGEVDGERLDGTYDPSLEFTVAKNPAGTRRGAP